MYKSLISLLILFALAAEASGAGYNVIHYGAKPDGKTDATSAFLKAWKAACRSMTATTITVPKGRYLLKPVEFRGPCRSSIVFMIHGTIVAPNDYKVLGKSGTWILFIKVNKVSVMGGTLDAKGAAFWACRKSGKNCREGARSITFNWANDVVVSGLTSINSQATHFVINSCKNVVVRNVNLYAPDQSPNTDGIHVQFSTDVSITGSSLHTGDDCISIGPGTKKLYITKIKCGPGHGVSIGSLGKDKDEAGVEDIKVTNSIFIGSDNGVRIKTWARPSNGFVKNVLFQNLFMYYVKNPIIIDQNYCPNNSGCSSKSSGVKISGVTYKNIWGISTTEHAMNFDCSRSKPCSGLKLQDIKLTYMKRDAFSSCKNVVGATSKGVVMPENCL